MMITKDKIFFSGKKQSLSTYGSSYLLDFTILTSVLSQELKKNVARPGLEPTASRLPCEYTTELQSHTINQLHFLTA